VRAGVPALVEAEVVESSVKYRPKRTLVVKLTDGERELWIRFLNFYPSQAKQFAPGKRVRLFGEVRRVLRRRDGPPALPRGREGRAAAEVAHARLSHDRGPVAVALRAMIERRSTRSRSRTRSTRRC
jgi:hypothetical protein